MCHSASMSYMRPHYFWRQLQSIIISTDPKQPRSHLDRYHQQNVKPFSYHYLDCFNTCSHRDIPLGENSNFCYQYGNWIYLQLCKNSCIPQIRNILNGFHSTYMAITLWYYWQRYRDTMILSTNTRCVPYIEHLLQGKQNLPTIWLGYLIKYSFGLANKHKLRQKYH